MLTNWKNKYLCKVIAGFEAEILGSTALKQELKKAVFFLQSTQKK